MKARDRMLRLREQYPLPQGRITPVVAEAARARGIDLSAGQRLAVDTPAYDPIGEDLRRLLAAGLEPAETLTDTEIMREQAKQALLLHSVRRLLPGRAREAFVGLLIDAIAELERG